MANKVKKKVRRRTDKQMEHDALVEENVSIFMVGLVVILCLVVGISVGVYLYDMALNNSAVVLNNLFKLLF